MSNAPIAPHAAPYAADGTAQREPDRAVMLEHLGRAVGKLRKARGDCIIEVLWSDPDDDKPRHSKIFGSDQQAQAVDWLAARNIERCNIFYRTWSVRRRVPAGKPEA